MNSGLYLVLLLHLYEQRFAALMRLSSNLVTIERVSQASLNPSQHPQPAGLFTSRTVWWTESSPCDNIDNVDGVDGQWPSSQRGMEGWSPNGSY